RYVPSLVQRELVDGGLLGRKSGEGFYRHAPPAQADAPGAPPPMPATAVTVHGQGWAAERLFVGLRDAGAAPAHDAGAPWVGLSCGDAQLRLTDGRPAQRIAAELGLPDIAVFDWPLGASANGALAFAVAASAREAWAEQVCGWLGAAGFTP